MKSFVRHWTLLLSPSQKYVEHYSPVQPCQSARPCSCPACSCAPYAAEIADFHPASTPSRCRSARLHTQRSEICSLKTLTRGRTDHSIFNMFPPVTLNSGLSSWLSSGLFIAPFMKKIGFKNATNALGNLTLPRLSEWLSSFLTAHQHIIGHSVP